MHLFKKFHMFVMIVAVVLILPACGKIENPSSSGSNLGGGPVKEFTVNARTTGYDVHEIKVKKGDTVKITLVNVQGMHSLKIKGYNKEVRGGKTVTFVADKTGEFEYACNISCGKYHNQMKGKLIVK